MSLNPFWKFKASTGHGTVILSKFGGGGKKGNKKIDAYSFVCFTAFAISIVFVIVYCNFLNANQTSALQEACPFF